MAREFEIGVAGGASKVIRTIQNKEGRELNETERAGAIPHLEDPPTQKTESKGARVDGGRYKL
ncbi:MAG TPA: hypothetical protein VGH37_03160 [Candidatus Acidoferrum sp.]